MIDNLKRLYRSLKTQRRRKKNRYFIPMRRKIPELLAKELTDVQPMQGPDAEIFKLKHNTRIT